MTTPRLLSALLLSAALLEAADDTERMNRLEQENAELRRRVEVLEGGQGGLEMAIEGLLAEGGDEGLGLNLTTRRGPVKAMLQVFGDVGFSFDDPPPADRSHTSFFLGGLNLFFTAQIGEHLSILSETVFKTSVGGMTDTGAFDQERLSATWTFSDLLYVKLGLDHGPVSRWNHLYHHGRWLETTIDRPFLARFEGAGGILPMHNSGLEAGGRVRTPIGRVEYVLIVSNGRGRTATDPQKYSDRNDGKAVEFGVSLAPDALEGIEFGFHFRVDDIPEIPGDVARARSIRELIGSLFVQYHGDRFEVIAEFVHIENRDRLSAVDFGHNSGYVQVAYRLRPEWLPYMRFDARSMDVGDPYYMPLGRDLDRWETLFGVRYDAAANVAIKLEFGFGRGERRASGLILTDTLFRLGLQVSWVF